MYVHSLASLLLFAIFPNEIFALQLNSNGIDHMSEEIEFNRLTKDNELENNEPQPRRSPRYSSTVETVAGNSMLSTRELTEEASGMKLLQELTSKQSVD